jgi:hypothetical protein
MAAPIVTVKPGAGSRRRSPGAGRSARRQVLRTCARFPPRPSARRGPAAPARHQQSLCQPEVGWQIADRAAHRPHLPTRPAGPPPGYTEDRRRAPLARLVQERYGIACELPGPGETITLER